jgi:hypothetical protein
MALSERGRSVLDLERSWWLEGRPKAEVVRARLGISLARYNQLLAALVEDPEALDYDPLVVRRLRKERARRRSAVMGFKPARDSSDKVPEKSGQQGMSARRQR